MYYVSGRSNSVGKIRLPEEYLMMARMGKRPSFGSNSSIGSAYSVYSAHSYSPGRQSPRRTSIDMRYNAFDSPRLENPTIGGKQYLLTVDEAYNKYRPPSTPELQTKGSSNENLNTRPYRRHSSFQGLGCEEQAVLEKIVRERRASLAPSQAGNMGPHILVSEPSVGDFGDEPYLYITPRRASTQSMGPVVVPEPGRRDSRGHLVDSFGHHHQQQRRSSFQGICESAMQFFAGK